MNALVAAISWFPTRRVIYFWAFAKLSKIIIWKKIDCLQIFVKPVSRDIFVDIFEAHGFNLTTGGRSILGIP